MDNVDLEEGPEMIVDTPSLMGKIAVVSWMVLFPVALMSLLYRYRNSYRKHRVRYTLSFLIVFVYLVFHAGVVFFMFYL